MMTIEPGPFNGSISSPAPCWKVSLILRKKTFNLNKYEENDTQEIERVLTLGSRSPAR